MVRRYIEIIPAETGYNDYYIFKKKQGLSFAEHATLSIHSYIHSDSQNFHFSALKRAVMKVKF